MSEPVVRRFPALDGEMELTTEIVSQNDDGTTTVRGSLRITKPITIAVFSADVVDEIRAGEIQNYSIDGEPVTDGS